MNPDNRLTRRAVATRRSNKETTISEAERAIHHRHSNPHNTHRYPAETKYDDIGKGHGSTSKRKKSIDNKPRRDSERILFLVLAVLGALLVIIAYSTFAAARKQENELGVDSSGPLLSTQKERVANTVLYEKDSLVHYHDNTPNYYSAESFMHLHPVHRRSDETIVKHEMPPDYGGLDLTFPKSGKRVTSRRIRNDPMDTSTFYRNYRAVERDDDLDNYNAFDDDYVRNPFIEYYDRDEASELETLPPDDGGLDLAFPNTSRQIRNDPMDTSTYYRNYRAVERDDDLDNYYAFDDDYVRNPFIEGYDQDEASQVEGFFCRRTSDHRLYFPNCNSFHEIPLVDSQSQSTIIGAGTYRQAMTVNNYFGQEQETFVVKDIHLRYDFLYDVYEYTRMDAIVAERLTSSKRIYDIYGACGIGIMSEFLFNGQIESLAIPHDDVYIPARMESTNETESPLICYNDLPGLTKLEMSFYMAEALADLHGYSGGVIVHQDVKLDQFYLNNNMTGVVLNDFNRAEFMLWDEDEEEYCTYKEGFGAGNWRAPEEYYDAYLNEKVDVFSMGNNMYSLLTGLMVFHEAESYEEVQHRVVEGEKPYIDPRYKERSLAEAKLAEIIVQCHEYYPEDRPSMFELADMLWEALEEVYDTTDEYDDGNNEVQSQYP